MKKSDLILVGLVLVIVVVAMFSGMIVFNPSGYLFPYSHPALFLVQGSLSR